MRKLSSFLLPSFRHGFAKQYCPFQTRRFLFSLGISADQDVTLLPKSQRNTFFGSNINQQYYYACYSSLENSVTAPSFKLSQCSIKGEIQGRNRVQVTTISEQKIKPSIPTPSEWKNYKISILDQLNPNTYLPMVYFYPNNHKNSQFNANEITLKRREILKQSLSETLTSFYPLAGKIHNNHRIECNDDGLYYVEARVSEHLSNFLKSPDHHTLINDMLPFHPNSIELMFKRCVAMVQVNIFECGGIAIGIYTSQKIMDNLSHITFLRAWAERAYGISEFEISPSYIAPTLFVHNPDIPEDASLLTRPVLSEQSKSVTKRFLFDSSSLILLKEKSDAFLSSMAVTGLIWKCVMAASEEKSRGFKKPSVLTLEVDLRARNSPPLSRYAIGNVSWRAVARCSTTNNDDDDRGLKSIVCKLQDASDGISGDFVEGIKGEKGCLRVFQLLNEFRGLYSNEKCEYLGVTSLCNGGIYEADFGWGKPSWACVANTANRGANRVILMDTRSGDGIEAWVTLSDEQMAIFERDSELLQFARSLDV